MKSLRTASGPMALVICLQLSAVAMAAGTDTAKSPTLDDASCATSTDPMETPSRFGPGSFSLAGKCLDTSMYRPVRDLKISGTIATFANYNLNGQFYRAEVDLGPDSIDSVYLHIKRFPIVKNVDAAHVQLRYVLAPGRVVKLTNQLTGKIAQATDFLVSFEGALDRGGSYNFAYGAFNNYALIGRVGDTATNLKEKARQIEQYELNLQPTERTQLLLMQLRRSESLSTKSFYNTLRPNCVTEVFDRMDELPSLAGKAEKFLTMISNDPVATPSLQALIGRGLLKRRVQDYNDEIKGVRAELPIEMKQTQLPAVLPRVEGLPWTIVVVNPEAGSLSAAERQAFENLRKELITRALSIVQSYASSTMLSISEGKAPAEMLLKAFQSLQTEMQDVLKRVDATMPAQAKTIGVYLVPMRADGSRLSLERFGLDATVPFKVVDHSIDMNRPGSHEILYWIGSNALSAADVGARSSMPAYLAASSVVISAQKGRSVVTSQALLGIKGMEKPFSQVNEQVSIDSVKVDGGSSRADRSMVLITHRQAIAEPLNKTINVEFGPAGGLAGTSDSTRFATLQLLKPLEAFGESCEVRARSVPQLTGKFGPKPTGNVLIDKIMAGRPAAFQILSVNMDLQKLVIEDMGVNVATWPIKCLSKAEVDEKFTAEGNQTVANWKQKIKTEGPQLLFNLLSSTLNK